MPLPMNPSTPAAGPDPLVELADALIHSRQHIGPKRLVAPGPDEAGLRGAAEMMQRVRGLGPDDLVIALVSGGGSALLSLPATGLTFADKQAINRALLESGAAIDEMPTTEPPPLRAR